MGNVHVTHFEAGTFTCQTTWTKGRYATLVGDFCQRIGLVHELGQLRSTEELLQRSRDGLAVDQVMRHQRLLLGLTQALFHSLLDTRQARTVLVFGQLTHATHATVAQVVDVINFAAAIAQIHEDLDHGQDVFVGQHFRPGRFGPTHLGVEFHTAHARQVIRVGVVEQALEQGLHRVFCWWLTGTHHAVNGNTGSELVHGFIGTQGLRDVGALVQLIGVDARQILHTGQT